MSASNENGGAHSSGVAVVIPYFQRESGLLQRALVSVFAQDCSPPPKVIVVDDASPISAATELHALSPEQKSRVTVIQQENSGPGAARNNGLDHLPDDTAYVAFLDSDDEWLPGHLARAMAALDAGHDLFFSNFRDIGQEIGGFEARGHLKPEEHDPLPGVAEVHVYQGDLRDAVLAGCPIETSTVVFSRAVFGDLRFRAKFRNSYEDYMFWFEMAACSPRVAFSAAVGTQYGVGINLYRGVDPGSDASLRVLVGSTKFGACVRAAFPLTPRQKASVKDRLTRNRCSVVGILMHRLRRRQRFPWPELAQYLKADPQSWLLIPWGLLRQSCAWVSKRPINK